MPTMIEAALRDTEDWPHPRAAHPLRGLAVGISLGLAAWVAAGWAVWLLLP